MFEKFEKYRGNRLCNRYLTIRIEKRKISPIQVACRNAAIEKNAKLNLSKIEPNFKNSTSRIRDFSREKKIEEF